MKMQWSNSAIWGALLLAACARPAPPAPVVGGSLPGLTQEQRQRFDAGRAVFRRVFSPETGLGPFFNSTSCAECHETPAVGGRGAGEQGRDDVETHATQFTASATCDTLISVGGPVFGLRVVPGRQPATIPADALI